jgi:hypothetical protein
MAALPPQLSRLSAKAIAMSSQLLATVLEATLALPSSGAVADGVEDERVAAAYGPLVQLLKGDDAVARSRPLAPSVSEVLGVGQPHCALASRGGFRR